MRCFVIMPFQPEFTANYEVIKRAVASAAAADPIACARLDEVRAAGRILADLLGELEEADFCIADATGLRPNVLYEVGFAAALKKPIIVISQDAGSLPFDI